MSKATVSAVAEPEIEQAPEKKELYTNWDSFTKAKLGVSSVLCAIIPGHDTMEACKTKIIPTAANVVNHIQHGGGFEFTIFQADKPWPGWKELEKAGVELQSIIDLARGKHLDLSARALKATLVQTGILRSRNQYRNKLFLHLGFEAPITAGDDYTNDPEQSFQ
jgi:hypothetical protein